MLRTELAIGYQIHFPLRRSQQRQRRSAKLTSPGRKAGLSNFTPPQEPGQDPIPSGHILQGRRINRSVPGRPAVPQAASAGTRGEHPGGVNVGHPNGPSTQALPLRAPKHTDIQASVLTTAAFKAAASPARSESRGPTRLALTRSQRPTRLIVTRT